MKAGANPKGKILGAILAMIFVLVCASPAHADVTASPTAINFGTQTVGTSSSSATVTVTNTGSRRVRLTSSISGAPFFYQGPSGWFSLQARQSVSVSVSFRPGAAQTFTGALTFKGTSGSRVVVSLSGTGVEAATTAPVTSSLPPSITSQPESRTVIAGQTASFSVSVSGTAPFTYQWKKNGASISGATSSSYTTPATVTSDNGAQFTVVVSNSAGNVTSNAATLTVTAATLLLSVNPDSLSFGDVSVGSAASRQGTLTNSGNGNVTLSGMSLSGAGFSASGVSSGQILTPGQTATLNVSFQPAVAGSVTGSVTVSSNAAPAVVTLSGSGVQQISHSVLLTWVRSTSTVSGYLVYCSQVSGGPYARLTASPITLSSYTDGSVENGKTYYYVVTSVDPSGIESRYSEQASALIQ